MLSKIIYAKQNNVSLPSGWKVLVAQGIKRQMQKAKIVIPEDCVGKWITLFKILNGK